MNSKRQCVDCGHNGDFVIDFGGGYHPLYCFQHMNERIASEPERIRAIFLTYEYLGNDTPSDIKKLKFEAFLRDRG